MLGAITITVCARVGLQPTGVQIWIDVMRPYVCACARERLIVASLTLVFLLPPPHLCVIAAWLRAGAESEEIGMRLP